MKRIKNLLLTLIIMSLGVITNLQNASAAAVNNGITVNYSIATSTSTVSPNQTFSVYIRVSGATKKIGSNDITLNYDSSKFEYLNYSTPSNVAASDVGINASGGKIIYTYFDMSGGSNAITDSTVVTFTFKALSNTNGDKGNISFSVRGVADEVANLYTVATSSGSTEVTTRINSSNSNLSSLNLSVGTLSPSFNKNTTKYTATIDAPSVNISAVTEDPAARIVTGTGIKNLNYGENTVTVVVRSQTGAEKVYTIIITRPDSRNTDNTLKELTVTNTNIKFNGNLVYQETVENDIKEVVVNARANNSKSKVEGTGRYTLKDGVNNITIKVTAENQKVRTYVVTINRKVPVKENQTTKSSNSFLSELQIQGTNLKFDKNVKNYTLNVPFSQEKLVITYKTEDKNAKVKVVGDENLLEGNNSIAVLVTAEDGSTRTYNFTIIREEEKELIENDKNSIDEAIKGNENTLTVPLIKGEIGTTLDSETLSALKESNKDLIFEWNDENAVLQSSLTIKGSTIELDTSEVIPNITSNLTDTLLKDYLQDKIYEIINTKDTNIPNGSIYKMRIDGTGPYTLSYYVNGELVNKTLNTVNGYVEFEVDKDIEYALIKRVIPQTEEKESSKFGWVLPVLIFIILVLILAIGTVIIVRKSRDNK